MTRISPDPIMPEGLEDFPWKDLLYMWDLDYHFRGQRLKLWLPFDESKDIKDIHLEAMRLHLAMWAWLADRHIMNAVPEFETTGDGYQDGLTGEQRWARCAVFSIFHLGARRSTPHPKPAELDRS